MREEPSGLDQFRSEADEEDEVRRKAAVNVLLEAKERLLVQLTEEILSHRESFLDDSSVAAFGFELQEIEDRYSVRLNSLSVLLEQLDTRPPRLQHRVETVTTTLKAVKKDLKQLVDRYDGWDLADFEVVPCAEGVVLIAIFVCEELGQ